MDRAKMTREDAEKMNKEFFESLLAEECPAHFERLGKRLAEILKTEAREDLASINDRRKRCWPLKEKLMQEHMQVICGDIKAEWVDLGEGLAGDYDPEDPEDVHLLRFDVYVRNADDEWDDPGEASYCTRMPADTKPDTLLRALSYIAQEANDKLNCGLKRRLQELSWISPDSLKEKA